jgi:hypothetical protein
LLGINPLRNDVDQQILVMHRGDPKIGTSRNAYRFRLAGSGVHIFMLNRLSAARCEAEPATRHQINLVFRGNVSRGNRKPLKVLIFLYSTLHRSSHGTGIAQCLTKNNIVSPATFYDKGSVKITHRQASDHSIRQASDHIDRPATNHRHGSDLPIVKPTTLYRQISDLNTIQTLTDRHSAGA